MKFLLILSFYLIRWILVIVSDRSFDFFPVSDPINPQDFLVCRENKKKCGGGSANLPFLVIINI